MCLTLLSISYIRLLKKCLLLQGMILIPDPLFNEPNVEQMRSTVEGDARSKAYNFEVRPPDQPSSNALLYSISTELILVLTESDPVPNG